jgi:hypothetical protein
MTDACPAPPHAGEPLPPWVLACLVAASTLGGFARLPLLGVRSPWAPIVGVLGIATLIVLRVLWARPRTAATGLVRAPIVLPSLLMVAAASISAVGATEQVQAFSHTLDVLGALGVLVFTLAADRTRLARVLAWVAACSVGLHVLLFAAGPGLGGLLPQRSWPFQIETHQHLGSIRRFYGTASNPFYCGVLMLSNAGLLEFLPQRTARRVLRATALGIAVTTLSFVTLLLPMLVLLRWPGRSRALTASLAGLTCFVALGMLYLHPLELHTSSTSVPLGTLHPNYGREGLGPARMPVRETTLPGVTLVSHPTAYFYLHKRALECFLEHPFIGVGGDNFEASCPVMTMDTYGHWSMHRSVHSEYLGALAEGGLVGLLAALCVLITLVRRYRLDPNKGWCFAVLLVYVASGVACPVLYRVPFAALLGLILRGQTDASSSPTRELR